MRPEMKKRYLILAIVGLTSFAADQATKIWARSALRSPHARRYVEDPDDGKQDRIPIIDGRFEFRLSFNPGAAFGMFADAKGGRWWLIIVGIFALGLIFYLLHRPEAESTTFITALSLVTGGAVGNLWDRILYGEVTDFIVVWVTERISWTWPWPAFNIADAALVVGVGLMMIQILFSWKDYEEAENTKGKKSDDMKDKKGKKRKDDGKDKKNVKDKNDEKNDDKSDEKSDDKSDEKNDEKKGADRTETKPDKKST